MFTNLNFKKTIKIVSLSITVVYLVVNYSRVIEGYTDFVSKVLGIAH